MNEDTQLTDDEIEKTTYKVLVFRWLAKQGVVTVLLCSILSSMIYGGYYAITTAIPAHIKQIQEGYDRIAAEHCKAVDRVTASQDREREAIYRLIDRRVTKIETDTNTGS